MDWMVSAGEAPRDALPATFISEDIATVATERPSNRTVFAIAKFKTQGIMMSRMVWSDTPPDNHIIRCNKPPS